MWPTGALLLFMGACPTGWAQPAQPKECHLTTDKAGRITVPDECISENYMRIAPANAQWCVKKPEATLQEKTP